MFIFARRLEHGFHRVEDWNMGKDRNELPHGQEVIVVCSCFHCFTLSPLVLISLILG